MTEPKENDTSFRVETPEGIQYTLYPAGICARFCAYGIDTVFQWLLLIVFIIAYAIVLNAFGGFWIILLFRFAVDWFYHVFFDIFFQGQSPGKRMMGLRVVASDGSPVSAGASFIRNLLRFVDGFIGLYLIAFLCTAVSRAFRRPGDWAAGTLVIYTWQSQIPRHVDKMAWLSGNVPVHTIQQPINRSLSRTLSRSLSYEEKQGILAFARRYPLLGAARANEIAAPLAASLLNQMPVKNHNVSEFSAPDNQASEYLLSVARSFAGES